MTLIDRIRQLQAETRLFPPGKVVVAVSGGADSITLLHALMALRDELQIELHVATLDHGIRGQAGADDVQFVQKLAREWGTPGGIPVSAERIDVPALVRRAGVDTNIAPHARRMRYEFQKNVEAVARRARYEFLVKVAREIGAGTIATGHHLDDQVETVLMHLLRGTGLAGLRGMQPVTPISKLNLGLDVPTDGINLVRPLLTTPRSEIEVYLLALNITARHDATNDDGAYLRNRLRRDVIPLLGEIAPHFREAVGRMSEVVGDDYAALIEGLPPLDSHDSIARSDFLALHPAQQRHLIALQHQRLFPTADALEAETLWQIQRFVAEARSGTSFNHWLHVRQERVYFYTDLAYPDFAPKLAAGTEIAVSMPSTPLGNGWTLQITAGDSQTTATVLGVRLVLPEGARLALRTPRMGDRYHPAGMGGKSQKLSDTFVNLKVPQVWRANIPLLTVNEEIAWFVAPVQDGLHSKVAEAFRPTIEENNDSTVSVCFAKIINQ